MKKYALLSLTLLFLLLLSCKPSPPAVIIIGEREVVNGDTIYPTVPDFAFVNQDSVLISNATFDGKIYVTDFFFTHCPSICPLMSKQMLRLYKRYENDDRVLLLSHSIDPKRDTVGRLKWYADNLGVKSSKWHFVTGDKNVIYNIAEKYYSIRPEEDNNAPGGFSHDAAFILVDKNRHIRGTYDPNGFPQGRFNGTSPEDVDRLMQTIDLLLKEAY